MSGTSLDGLDLIYVEFDFLYNWHYKIVAAETIPYSGEWQQTLTEALYFSEEKLRDLNQEFTVYLSGLIAAFIQKHELTNLDAVCSHGHTIKHEPENNYTLQIGNLPELAKITGQKVVCDFRVQDVALNGQGAPLVPVGDEILFSEYKYCLNLGGFANISTSNGNQRLAYDICPVNTVLNYYSRKLGFDYDENGKTAASGQLNEKLLNRLNNLAFYFKDPPKSLGIEWVNKEIFPLLRAYDSDIPSVLHTYSVHVAQQVANTVDDDANSKILVTGGGAFNGFLLNQFRVESNAAFVVPSPEIINFKEALVFGLLGVLKIRGEINVLSSVTGAKKNHSSGIIFDP